MSEFVTGAVARYDFPDHGDDRVFMDHAAGIYADIDGSAGSTLSSAVVKALPGLLKYDLVDMFGELSRLETRDNATLVLTKATDLKQSQTVRLETICAGDSWAILYNPAVRGLFTIAHQTELRIQTDDGWRIDAQTFLSAKRAPRSHDDVVRMIKRVELPIDEPWRFILMSDGVKDDSEQGISFSKLRELCHFSQPEALPQDIIDAIPVKYDDASVVVIYPVGT